MSPEMTTQLTVNEIYKSIQGETSWAGHLFSFIRLSGCSLRCSWCDTAYAFKGGLRIPLDVILAQVAEHQVRHVLVTGGEPLDQPECPVLIEALLDEGYTVLVETSGSHSIQEYPRLAHYIVDYKLPGSKMHGRNHPRILSEVCHHDEVKFVIKDQEDYEVAKEVVKNHNLMERTSVLFSCVFGVLPYQTLVGWMLKDNCDVKFQLQMHKHIWDPATRGV
jgi:7-carboxy-7-deazaguanine synthase